MEVAQPNGPVGNLFAKSIDKCPRSKKEFQYDSGNEYIHNTTGDKDRKKRKIKTLFLSG